MIFENQGLVIYCVTCFHCNFLGVRLGYRIDVDTTNRKIQKKVTYKLMLENLIFFMSFILRTNAYIVFDVLPKMADSKTVENHREKC